MSAQYLVPALIAAIVSVMVVFLSRRSETKKHLELLRTTAYVDFVRGVAGLAVLQKRPIDTKEEFLKGNELTMLVADAKARIALYGSFIVGEISEKRSSFGQPRTSKRVH